MNSESRPDTLLCYSLKRCGDPNSTMYESKPDDELCSYSRTDCGASQPTILSATTSPPPSDLTCYTRKNCDGSTTGPTATVLGRLTCPSSSEVQPTFDPTITVNPATKNINYAQGPIPYAPYGGSPISWTKQAVSFTYQSGAARSTAARSVEVTEVTTPPRTSYSITPTSFVPTSCPTGTSQRSCTIPALPGVPDPLALTPARYYYYAPEFTDEILGQLGYPPGSEKGFALNYKIVQIDRTRPAAYRYKVIDAATGAAVTAANSQRTDCAALTECTYLEEAQNFANWYLYYRNRLFAAQAVVADSLSSMTSTSQQKLRLGFGRINYFENSFNPWMTEQMQTIGSLPSLDGQANAGAMVRGVRSFVTGSQDRRDVFDWLFSLSWVGATPNREAVDSVGRYFTRTDNKGPWGATPGIDDSSPQLACRRNSLFLTTDGEWTNFDGGQPLIAAVGPVEGTGGPQESDNVSGPTITGSGVNAGASFTYLPDEWPQYTGGESQSKTLTDAAVYYWNHDLRPDMPNVVLPVTDTRRPNPAFWQSMSTYILGYGLSAAMDTPETRDKVARGERLVWPTVDLSSTLGSGGNRVDDSLRAALASRGNFYAAQSTNELKNGVLNSFLEISTRQGSAGGVAISGPQISSTSQAFFPSYTTGKWTGSLKAYKSDGLEALAKGSFVAPDWIASLPDFGSRNIFSSSARNISTTFDAGSLSSEQSASLTSTTTGLSYTAAEAVKYLRGDQSLELPATGIAAGTKFRRRESLLGDIVNSTPLFVKAPDYGYAAMPNIGTSYASCRDTLRGGNGATG